MKWITFDSRLGRHNLQDTLLFLALTVDPKWLFFPHKGMFRSIWAQVRLVPGRMVPVETCKNHGFR